MSDNSLNAVTPGGAPIIADAEAVAAYLEALRSQAEPEGQRTVPKLIDMPEETK